MGRQAGPTCPNRSRTLQSAAFHSHSRLVPPPGPVGRELSCCRASPRAGRHPDPGRSGWAARKAAWPGSRLHRCVRARPAWAEREPARPPVSRVLCRRSRGGDGHPSWAPVARRLERPTRGRGDAPLAATPKRRHLPSYLALLQVELARFTRSGRPAPASRFVTVALVRASRRTGVTRYPASGSSDFPRVCGVAPPPIRDHPAASLAHPIVRAAAICTPRLSGASGCRAGGRSRQPGPSAAVDASLPQAVRCEPIPERVHAVRIVRSRPRTGA